jgi:RHS repeat-associated protein
VGYGYDNVGNRSSVTYPGGSDQVTYDYDDANNLTSVTDWNSNETTYAYNNAGMLTTVTLPSGTGIVGTYGYDNADRLTSISWVKGGSTTVASVSYTLDPVGNRKTRIDGLGQHTYAYDPLHRLTSVTYPGPSTDNYTYDAVGNRLTKNSDDYTYDAADRLTGVEGVSYTFDDNGNLTDRGTDEFAWDAEDRLTSTTVASTTTTFGYNGDGLRNSLTTGGNTTTFTWDIASSIPQVIDDGTLDYVYGLGRIAKVKSDDTTHYYLTDGLGSTMKLVQSDGDVENSYEYDVFGAVRSSSGSEANAFRFTGEQVDSSTGLEYLRARYYDMETGRFVSRDTVLGLAEAPVTQHLFIYAGSSPNILVDPTGHSFASATPGAKEGRPSHSSTGPGGCFSFNGGMGGPFEAPSASFCAGGRGPGGPSGGTRWPPKATAHGSERLRNWSQQEYAAVKQSGRTYTQADGATSVCEGDRTRSIQLRR